MPHANIPFLILVFVALLLGITLRLSRSARRGLSSGTDRADEALLIGLLLFGVLVVGTFLVTAFG
jgi:hypothetical protein